MKLLELISLALAFSLASAAHTVELQSPRITNTGKWRGWKQCDEGTYAAGIQIRYHTVNPEDENQDKSGLNDVALYCLPINWHSFGSAWIMSGRYGWGDWQAVKWCPRGQVIVGFQLRSEREEAKVANDAVAADNFAAFCGSPFSAPDHDNWIMGDTAGKGEWTSKQFCPQSYAVCGINAQIDTDKLDYNKASGVPDYRDSTGLNNVDLRCCEVEYSCNPDAELVTLDSFDNTGGGGDMQYEYTVHTSFTKMTSTSESMSSHEKAIIAAKISAELGVESSFLTAKLSAEMSSTLENGSTRSLQTMVQQTSQHSTTKKLVVNIPKGTKSVIKQLQFTCGGYRMALAKTINQQFN